MTEQSRNKRITCHERRLGFIFRRAFIFLAVAGSVSALPVRAQSPTCSVKTDLPIGVTNQNGYSFDYQSGNGPKCRRYRLRNKPGKVLTPPIWKDKTETFLDVSGRWAASLMCEASLNFEDLAPQFRYVMAWPTCLSVIVALILQPQRNSPLRSKTPDTQFGWTIGI